MLQVFIVLFLYHQCCNVMLYEYNYYTLLLAQYWNNVEYNIRTYCSQTTIKKCKIYNINGNYKRGIIITM